MASDDFAGMQRRLSAVAAMVEGELGPLAGAGALAAKKEVVDVARAVTGGDGRLSHMGRRGVKLGAGYEVTDGGRRVVLGLRPPGAWTIVERGARPHLINRKGRRKAPVLFGAGWAHPVPAPVRHPGSPGRDGITRAFDRARVAFPKGFHDAELRRLSQIFAG